MPPHRLFLVFALSFLSGVLYASMGLSLLLAAAVALILACALSMLRLLVGASLVAAFLLVTGAVYYQHDETRYETQIAAVPTAFAPATPLVGRIAADPRRDATSQSFPFETSYGVFSVFALPTPAYRYGDELLIAGAVRKPGSAYDKAHHLVGTLEKPATALRHRAAPSFLSFLFTLKERARSAYTHYLPTHEAALLSGIMFGGTEGFSATEKNDLDASGLRFITAIDGLHMQILLMLFAGVLAWFLPRRALLPALAAFAFSFVALTGFTLSGIRAASMALLARFAQQSGRLYAPENALALVALLLVLYNPQTLFFDVGFQLSFLAVLSILYLMPAFLRLAPFAAGAGFLSWRESLRITLAVQLVTAPVVIAQFGSISAVSLIASVLVVWLLPLLLGGGFVLAFATPLPLIAAPAAFALRHVLSYVLFIAHFSSMHALPLSPRIDFLVFAPYYAALCLIVLRASVRWRARRRSAHTETRTELPTVRITTY